MDSSSQPLSNREVLKVLKAREHNKCTDVMEYLESVTKGSDKYPMEMLRGKEFEADMVTLTNFSNSGDLGLLSSQDRKLVQKLCNQS